MTRSILAGLLGVLSVAAIGTLPLACQSGGVGDPCTPEDEYDPQFPGFKVTQENIESRSFQCKTRICLVNHFQGRTSCPLGQDPPEFCDPGNPQCSDSAKKCVEAQALAQPCAADADCAATTGICNKKGGFCACTQDAQCLLMDKNLFCDVKSGQCKSFVCHKPGDCQSGTKTEAENKTNGIAKACCIPGTDTPVAVPVCGQCGGPPGKSSTRSGDQAVYCSCRCDVADGQPKDPNFNFCDCPKGFSCTEIRENVGLGDAQITGKYCVKDGTAFQDKPDEECGKVKGYFNSTECRGNP